MLIRLIYLFMARVLGWLVLPARSCPASGLRYRPLLPGLLVPPVV